jgi:copper chaperone NosL
MKDHLSGWVRAIVILCGLALFAVLFVPMWQIQLSAPQYPEGLVLLIYPNALGGNVDIINGLNHYIGMQTLHANDFAEFTILPYIIIAFACITVLTGIVNRRKLLVILTVSFIVFAVIAMADFWRWEYNYGHNLNPDAAIIVPGMAYQPPLIGFKQLLNFGAYSIPDVGGWIFILCGALLASSSVFEIIKHRKLNKIKKETIFRQPVSVIAAVFAIVLFLTSCNAGPEPLHIGKENCNFCKMTISDARFGAEIITHKGKLYKFDDMHCIISSIKSGVPAATEIKEIYLTDYSGKHELRKSTEMFLLKSEALRSPMNGNIAAFSSKDSLNKTTATYKGEETVWADILK